MPIREQKPEFAIDTMASWTLEGMTPDRETLWDLSVYIDGSVTL